METTMTNRSEGQCVLCTIPGKHLDDCVTRTVEGANAECTGCVPTPAQPGSRVCGRCFAKLRRHLQDAPDLIASMRAKIDPSKARAYDRGRGAKQDHMAPLDEQLVEASRDLMRMLHDWARSVSALLDLPVRTSAELTVEVAYDDAYWLAQVVLADLGPITSSDHVGPLAVALLADNGHSPAWWSVADALRRWPVDDRVRPASKPCPECTFMAVTVIPARQRTPQRYICGMCQWEADATDDAGLWGDVFGEDWAAELAYEASVEASRNATHDPDLLTLAEAARRVKRNPSTVRAWAQRGLITPELGRYRFTDLLDLTRERIAETPTTTEGDPK